MATITAPTDPRPQFTTVGLALAHAFGGGPSLDQFQQIGPDRYILPNAWPTPKASGEGFSSAVAASQAAPEVKPRTAASALWPHLR
jgi:hypothetical protein